MHLKGDVNLKRIFFALLFVLLFPVLVFSEDSKVTFSPSDTQLQGQPAVICETSFYRIKLPQEWNYTPNYYKDTMIALTGFSPDYHLNITVGLYTKPLSKIESDEFDKNYNILIDEIKNTPQVTIKEIKNVLLPNTNCKRLIIFVPSKSLYTVMYIINKENYPFSINFLSYPSEYESKLPLFDEIVSTLEFK